MKSTNTSIKPHKVFIIGSDFNAKDIALLKRTFPKDTFIGDGERTLAIKEEVGVLKDFTAQPLQIYILAHGSIHNKQHVLTFSEGNHFATKNVLAYINDITTAPSQERLPLEIYLVSCFSGAAAKDIASLGKDDTLISLAGIHPSTMDLSIKEVVESANHPSSNAWEFFARSISSYADDKTLSLYHHGKKFQYTSKAPRQLLNDTALSAFLAERYQEFQKAVENFDPSIILPPFEQPTATQLAHYRVESCFSALNRGDTRYIEHYLQAGYSADAVLPSSGTPLLLVASTDADHYDVFTLLLKYNANPNLSSFDVGGSPVIEAAKNGNIIMVNDLLAAGANPNSVEFDGSTGLTYAARNGHAEIVDILLEKGGKVNLDKASKKYNFTPLYIASYSGHLNIVRRLLAEGADPHIAGYDGTTAIFRASQGGYTEIVWELVQAGADVNKPTNVYNTPLASSTQHNHTAITHILLEAGAEPNVSYNSKDGANILLFLATKGDKVRVQLLIDRGADVNLPRLDGITPLIAVAYTGDEGMAELLLKGGANPDQRRNDGNTALIIAVSKGHFKVAELLLQHGANPALANNKGRTAFDLAKDNRKIIKLLESYQEKTPLLTEAFPPMTLCQAVQEKNIRAAKHLLATGTHPDTLDGVGNTPLLLAAGTGNMAMAKLLLPKGADANFSRGDGLTPISWAAARGDTAMVSIFLDHKASPDITDSNGITATFWAAENNNLQMMRKLVGSGANVNVQRKKDGYAALHWAAQHNNTAMVDFLLDNGAKVSVADYRNMTAIYWAVGHNNTKMVTSLLRAEADTTIAFHNIHTPLKRAESQGFTAIAGLLRNPSLARLPAIAVIAESATGQVSPAIIDHSQTVEYFQALVSQTGTCSSYAEKTTEGKAYIVGGKEAQSNDNIQWALHEDKTFIEEAQSLLPQAILIGLSLGYTLKKTGIDPKKAALCTSAFSVLLAATGDVEFAPASVVFAAATISILTSSHVERYQQEMQQKASASKSRAH